MDALYRLIYTSFLSADADPPCVGDIVRGARKTNRSQAITGVLIFDGIRFCQYLEGPRPAVLGLVERIRHDTRHIQFEIKAEEPLPDERRLTRSPLAYALCADPEGLNKLHKFGPNSAESAFILFERSLPCFDLDSGDQ